MLEGAFLANLAQSDWSWAPVLGDFDNDGLLDVFISNGMTRLFTDSDRKIAPEAWIGKSEFEVHLDAPENREQNLAFANLGELRFADVSERWGLDQVGMSFASATGDLDNDGDLDLVVCNLNEPLAVYQNQSRAKNRLVVHLRGPAGNRDGIGAVVTLRTDRATRTRTILPQSGFAAQHEAIAHFGWGECERLNEIRVVWPDGQLRVIRELPDDTSVTITHDQGVSGRVVDARPAQVPWFAALDLPQEAIHVEREFDDFAHQPLLPNKYSQLGPGIACGDIDGDGDEDLYIGGAAGQAGHLLRNDKGTLVSVRTQSDLKLDTEFTDPFTADAECEDMGCLLFDADGDDDLDLYVVSGSYEHEQRTEAQRDRFYLNDGRGNFTRLNTALPDVTDCGGPICAADFDRDGDLDLFVGGRLTPREFPLPATSRLLVNESSEEGVRFVDRTQQVAPELLNAGLVTGACWSDANDDGWVDLLVTTEWGPIRYFQNQNGAFQDHTKRAGLSDLFGWWNAITARDLDNDGDIDYAVANYGLNTKYHPTAEKPVVLYYGEFGKDGKRFLVEAKQEHEHLLPVRGRSCSSTAMPHLKEKFPTYRAFASAFLGEIYEQDCLQSADRWAVNELSTGILRNDGQARFTFEPLPRLAQISPAFGILAAELNGDPFPDIYLVQNFFNPQIETGRHDGGLSQLLVGSQGGELKPMPPEVSGLTIHGDAMALIACDLDGDSRPDLVSSVNDGHPRAFANQRKGKFLAIRLRGNARNAHAIGARVNFTSDDGMQQTAEVSAGAGYLSQSSSMLWFGLANDVRPATLHVRWPDGTISKHALDGEAYVGRTVVVEQPMGPLP